MIRSGTIHTIHDLQTQGKSIREMARILGIARNTVRRYLRGKPEAVPRPKRDSVLDSYKAQIHRWIQQDHLYNCETKPSQESKCSTIGAHFTTKKMARSTNCMALPPSSRTRACASSPLSSA